MKRLFDHDPVAGVTTWYDYDPVQDEVTLSYQQDVGGFLDVLRQKRNNDEATKQGIKNSMWHYATLPPVVIMELKQRGIDVFDPSHTKALMKAINADFPACKVTSKVHR
jgi:hypothetical protein